MLLAGLAEVIEDYGMVSYTLLAIENKDSVQRLLALIDKATGYVFTGLRDFTPYPPEFVYGAGVSDSGGATASMWERYRTAGGGGGAYNAEAVVEREPQGGQVT